MSTPSFALPLRFPPVAGFVAASIDDATWEHERSVLHEMVKQAGGRVSKGAIDSATGVSACSSPGWRAGALSAAKDLYVGRPDPNNLFVSATLPCATEAEAWDELALAMALHQPGRFLAMLELDARVVATPSGPVGRRDTFEAREIDGGVQLFLMTVTSERAVAQSRIYDATGRSSRVFKSAASALDFAHWYKRRFVPLGVGEQNEKKNRRKAA